MKSEARLAILLAVAMIGVGCGDDTDPMTDAGIPMDGAMTLDGGETDAGTEDGGAVHMGETTMGRLFVADDSGNVMVYELDTDEPALLDTFTVGGAARLYGDIHGRMAYLVQRDANAIAVANSGIVFESHVDHYHLNIGEPGMMEHSFSGMLPTHFTQHDGWVAAFYDGSGDVDIMQERSLLAGSPVVTTLSTGHAHHGAAVVTHGHAFATVAPEAGDFPNLPPQVGIWGVTELAGEPEAMAMPCPGLHGEVAAGEFVAFGCADGVLVAEYHDGHFDISKLDNPEGTIEGERISFLAAHDEAPLMWGNMANIGYVLIDPEAGSVELNMLEHGMTRAFGFDMHGEHMFMLTVDGTLHRFEADGTPAGTLQLTDTAITPGSGPNGVNPAIAAGAGRMYVSLPAENVVHEIHIEDFEVERSIALAGAPFSVRVVSVSPDWSEDGHDHDHE